MVAPVTERPSDDRGGHAAGAAATGSDWEKREANLIEQIETLKLALSEVYSELGERDRLRAQLESALQQLRGIQGSWGWRIIAPIQSRVGRYPAALVRRARAFVVHHPALARQLVQAIALARRVLHAVRNRLGSAKRRIRSMLSPSKARQIQLRSISPEAREAAPHRLTQGSGKRILCVGHVMPYPPRAGNEYRIHRMLRWLSEEGYDVLTVICPLSNETPSERQLAQAAAIYPQLIVCQHNGVVHHNLRADSQILGQLSGLKVQEFAELLGEPAGPDPRASALLSTVRSFCPDALIQVLVHLEKTFRPKALLAEYVFMSRAMPLLSSCKIIDTHDVFSTKADRLERYGVSDGLAMSEAEEAELMHRADVLIGIQARESQEIERLAPERAVVTVGVDFDVKTPVLSRSSNPVVLMVGSRNPMNVLGLQDFLRYSWPFVRRAIPQAEFRVVGDVGAGVESSHEGVHILGRVDSLDEQYADAWVVINPTIAGTGLKVKTVEALSHLRPVVTFPAGVDGVGEVAGQYCRVVTDWYSFAREVAIALEQPPPISELESRSRVLSDCLSARVVYAPLKRVLDEV